MNNVKITEDLYEYSNIYLYRILNKCFSSFVLFVSGTISGTVSATVSGTVSVYTAVCMETFLLQVMYSVRRCWDVVSPHVLVHLGETVLDVVLGAAFSHGGKTESLRGMM